MFNYYKYSKEKDKTQKEVELKKNEINQHISKIAKQEEMVFNYDNRIKKFMFDIIRNPVQIDNKESIIKDDLVHRNKVIDNNKHIDFIFYDNAKYKKKRRTKSETDEFYEKELKARKIKIVPKIEKIEEPEATSLVDNWVKNNSINFNTTNTNNTSECKVKGDKRLVYGKVINLNKIKNNFEKVQFPNKIKDTDRQAKTYFKAMEAISNSGINNKNLLTQSLEKRINSIEHFKLNEVKFSDREFKSNSVKKLKLNSISKSTSEEYISNLLYNMKKQYPELNKVNPLLMDINSHEESFTQKYIYNDYDKSKFSKDNLSKINSIYLDGEMHQSRRGYYENIFRNKIKFLPKKSFLKADPELYFKTLNLNKEDTFKVTELVEIDGKNYRPNDLKEISQKLLKKSKVIK